MNRRDLLIHGLGGASIVGSVALGSDFVTYAKADLLRSTKRISNIKGDAGEIFYAECVADGRPIKIWIDGAEAKDCVTADEGLGLIVRAMRSPNGNILFNTSTSEVIHETVRGKVVIEIGEPSK